MWPKIGLFHTFGAGAKFKFKRPKKISASVAVWVGSRWVVDPPNHHLIQGGPLCNKFYNLIDQIQGDVLLSCHWNSFTNLFFWYFSNLKSQLDSVCSAVRHLVRESLLWSRQSRQPTYRPSHQTTNTDIVQHGDPNKHNPHIVQPARKCSTTQSNKKNGHKVEPEHGDTYVMHGYSHLSLWTLYF